MNKILRGILDIALCTMEAMSEIKVCPKCNQTFKCSDSRRIYCVRCSKNIKSIDNYRELNWTTRKKKKRRR